MSTSSLLSMGESSLMSVTCAQWPALGGGREEETGARERHEEPRSTGGWRGGAHLHVVEKHFDPCGRDEVVVLAPRRVSCCTARTTPWSPP